MLAVAVLFVGCGNTDTTDNAQGTEAQQTQEEQKQEETHTHAYTEAITTEATCEADGLKTFTCECGDSYTEVITATGHNYEEVADSAVEATCDTDGKEADTKCSICENVVEGAVITASGHSYGEYVYNNDATTSADGTETATCSTCGKKNTRTKSGTKLVKEELDEPVQPSNPGECPVPLNQIIDCGDYFYVWRCAHTQDDMGQSAIFIAADQYARNKWGDNFGTRGCNDHIKWNGYIICQEVWYAKDGQ